MTIYDDLYSAPEKPYTINPPPYKVTASFRMFHDELDPDKITKDFQIEPSMSHRKGDERIGKSGKVYSPYSKGAWILSSDEHVFSVDANDHIEWLLEALLAYAKEIRYFQDEGYFIDIHCGWHTEGWNTCPRLNSSTIALLDRFRLDCWFDVYSY